MTIVWENIRENSVNKLINRVLSAVLINIRKRTALSKTIKNATDVVELITEWKNATTY